MSDIEFSKEEIAAFDRGVEDGFHLRHNPYDFFAQCREHDAWETGASIGRMNRRYHPPVEPAQPS